MKTKKSFGKKILSTLFLLCLITSTVSIQTNASEDINETLLQKKMCDFDSKKKLHMIESRDSIEVYDENGREIYKLIKGSDRSESYSTYDSYGKLQSEFGVKWDDAWGTSYVYDDNQRLEYTITYEKMFLGESQKEKTYKISFYNDFGQPTSIFLLDANGKERSRDVNTYDSNGNLLTRQWYSNGEEGDRNVYTYDDNGNELTWQRYYNGKEESRDVYTYDSNGNMLTSQYYYQGEEVIRDVNTYDSNGNMLERAHIDHYDANFEVYTQYAYNANGDVLSENSCYITRKWDNGGISIPQIVGEQKYEYNQNGDILSSIDISYKMQNGSWIPYQYVEEKYEYDQDGDIVAEYSRNSLESDFEKIVTYTYYLE